MKSISRIITEGSASMNLNDIMKLNDIIGELNTIIGYEYQMTIEETSSSKKDRTAFEIADKIINYFGYKNLEKIYTKHFNVDVERNRTHIRTDIKDRILMNIPFTK